MTTRSLMKVSLDMRLLLRRFKNTLKPQFYFTASLLSRVLEHRRSLRTTFRIWFVSARWSFAVACLFTRSSHTNFRVSSENLDFLPVCLFQQNLLPISHTAFTILLKSSSMLHSVSSTSNRFWSSICNLSEPLTVLNSVGRSVDFIRWVLSSSSKFIFRVSRTSRWSYSVLNLLIIETSLNTCLLSVMIKSTSFLLALSGFCQVHLLWGYFLRNAFIKNSLSWPLFPRS